MSRELLFDVSKFEVAKVGSVLEWFYKEWATTSIPTRFMYAKYFPYNHSYTIHYMLGWH